MNVFPPVLCNIAYIIIVCTNSVPSILLIQRYKNLSCPDIRSSVVELSVFDIDNVIKQSYLKYLKFDYTDLWSILMWHALFLQLEYSYLFWVEVYLNSTTCTCTITQWSKLKLYGAPSFLNCNKYGYFII